MKRAFCGKGMLCAVLVGLVISAVQVFQYQVPLAKENLAALASDDFAYLMYPYTAADSWLAGNVSCMESFLYFFLLPVLAVLPFGLSFLYDRRSGYARQLRVRSSQKDYMEAKYLAAFLSGGTAVTIPLLVNYLAALMLLPDLLPSIIYPRSLVDASALFNGLYFHMPEAYCVLFLGIDFILGGSFACISLAVSCLMENRIVALSFPFLMQLFFHSVATLTGKARMSSVYWPQAGSGIISEWILPAYLLVYFALPGFIIFMKGCHEDIL